MEADNPDFKYDKKAVILIAIACSASGIGILLMIAKVIIFCRTSFEKIRTDQLYVVFIGQIMIGITIICTALMYEIGDILMIFVDIFLSFSLWFFYVYIKECVMFFTHVYLRKNPEVKNGLIKSKEHDKLMFEYDPPMKEISKAKRFHISNLFVEYTYLLCGEGTHWFCCKKRISNYKQAHSFHRWNTISMASYLIVISIFFSLEVILRRTVGLDFIHFQKVNFGTLIKISSLVVTVMAIPRINSFATTFAGIYPWFNSKGQLTCVIFMKLTATLTSAVLNFTNFEIGDNDETDTRQLLVATVYSIFYLLLVILGMKVFNASIIKKYEIQQFEAQIKEDLKRSLLTSLNLDDSRENSSIISK